MDSKLKYTTMEKQAYVLVKSSKNFRIHVGYSKIVSSSFDSKVCLGLRGLSTSKEIVVQIFKNVTWK